MKKYATVDSTQFPLIRVRFTGEKATEENFLLYLREVESIYDRKSSIGILFDATQASFPGLKYQNIQARWLKDHKQLMEKYCAGTAYVIPNVLIRQILKAIFTLQQQPIPYTVCGERAEAEKWLQAQLMQS